MLDALLSIELTVGGLLWAILLYVIPVYVVYRTFVKKAIDRKRATQLDSYFKVAGNAKELVDGFKVVGKKKEPAMEDIPLLVKEMRASFDAGISRPIHKRLEQLHAMRRLFEENQQAIERPSRRIWVVQPLNVTTMTSFSQ